MLDIVAEILPISNKSHWKKNGEWRKTENYLALHVEERFVLNKIAFEYPPVEAAY